MLPPKEEGEAAHLHYPENYTPTTKSVSNLDQEFQSPDTNPVPRCPEEFKELLPEDISDPPETPQEETCTSLVVIDSEPQIDADMSVRPSSPSSEIGITQVLENLENDKTPEPLEMDNSIVRASFVDFTTEDEALPCQNGQPLEEESGEDEDSKEFSLSLNPDLPKIRAQQIQNWLEFDKDQELSHDLNNNIPESGSSSLLEDSIEKPVNISQDFDLDSLSEAGQMMTEDADGMGRRVRFLTDPEGNILISVYLTKLVQLILSILKLASAGYLDFTSSKPSSSVTSSSTGTLASFGLSSSDSDISSAGQSDADIPDFACHYNETDNILNNISGEGEEMEQHQVIPQSQVNHQEVPIAQVIESQTEKLDSKREQVDVNDNKPDEFNRNETNENSTVYDPIDQEAPVRVIDEVKKVVSVDPSLNLKDFEDCEDDTGSDTETLSTSSCSSMIEVIPREKHGDIQLIKDNEDDGLDGNKNELKTDVIFLEDPEIKDKSITCYEFQPENEVITSDTLDHNEITTDAALVEVDKPKNVKDIETMESTLTALSVEKGDKTSWEVASSLSLEIPSDDKKETVDLLKFNPIIEQEVNQPKYISNVSSVDLNNNSNGDYNESADVNCQHLQDEMAYDDDPEKQLVSLCIEEEPISAVALTIAKWESFSKKQKQMKQSERSNIITKGKVHLQSYTNNPNNTVTITGNAMMSTTNSNIPSAQVNGHGQGKIMSSNFSTPGKAMQLPSSALNAQQLATAAVSAYNNNINNMNGNNKTGPGWNCWTNNKTNENKHILEGEEAIYAQPNSQGGSLSTSLANPSSILRTYPKPNSRGEIINWFKEGEIHRSGILLSYGQTNHHSHPTGAHQTVTSPVIVSWFFGLITRQQAEELLLGQPTGSFLVRISTRIWGYTLSYQSNNTTKHFLISAINPAVPQTLTAGTEMNNEGQNGTNGNPTQTTPTGKKQLLIPFSPGGRYAFIGTNMTPYTTLTSLIRHHSHAPITKAGGEKLIIPCSGGPKIAGIEYVFK